MEVRRVLPTGVTSPIKWAGGKRWLISKLLKVFPKKLGWYVEPFAGGASVFFSLAPERAILADYNNELIVTYSAIRDAPSEVWKLLQRHAVMHCDEHYYQIRASKPRIATQIAARFLYLNRACWNGLFRMNLRGEFNVPRGTKDDILLATDEPYVLAELLAGTELLCTDFEMAVDAAGRGDLIYADPPYTVKHNFNGFIKYNESIFRWTDQERLARSLRRARRRGAFVVVSNADHASIREIYRGDFRIVKVNRASVIAGDVAARGQSSELLIIGEPTG